MMVFFQMGQSGSVAIDRQVQLNGSHEPDCFLLCCKQRNYCGADDGEPDIALWRHHDAGLFVADAGDVAPCFLNVSYLATPY
ncbi:MAG: hypothetical protein GZ085_10180 [Sulfuriferula multivorans]|uniref:Uncharacterized protein n=1 Tax=Sulfuriferula multivorans TaxID=1559896 RepID=A0A7C9P8K4_9PROT|nr:hypothetical protein [Sulfuriferula multivorans]